MNDKDTLTVLTHNEIKYIKVLDIIAFLSKYTEHEEFADRLREGFINLLTKNDKENE